MLDSVVRTLSSSSVNGSATLAAWIDKEGSPNARDVRTSGDSFEPPAAASIRFLTPAVVTEDGQCKKYKSGEFTHYGKKTNIQFQTDTLFEWCSEV